MNQLINSDNLTMSSREIAELTGKQLSHVHRDFKAMTVDLGFSVDGFNKLLMPSPNMDQGFTYEMDEQKRIKTIFLNRELTLTLVSGYSAKLRNAIIKRWQALESKQPTLPATFGEALQLAANQALKIETQNKLIALQAPAVKFVESYTQADSGSKGFRQVAKLLKVKENIFRAFLVDHKIMYRLAGEWTAHANHIDAGRFEVTTGESNKHIHNTTKFTAKGINWIAGLWAIELIALGEEK